ncbi:MAG: hypothetical protein GXO43_03955 [Crenarchaeota archaeon]|nr:hypothetical protein [Thermoproteota archaeon]
MSTIIRELMGDGETVVYLVLNEYYEFGSGHHITSYVEIMGRRDMEVADIFAENGYEPHYFNGVHSLVLYNTFKDSNEAQMTLSQVFKQLKAEEPDTFIMARYKAYNHIGKKYKDVEYRFFASEENCWKHFIYEVTPYAQTY